MTYPNLIRVEDSSTPLARVVFHFLGGACIDPVGYEGLSCLMNRLMLRGTTEKTRTVFENHIEQMGVSLIPSCSADSLSIGGAFHRRHAQRWLELIGETLTKPLFDVEEIERAKRELQAELDLIMDEDASFGRLILKRALFEGTRYAHPSMGTRASLEGIDRTMLMEQVHQTYTQSRLLIGCAGDVADQEIKDALNAVTKSLPVGESPDFPELKFGAQTTKFVIVDKPERSQCQLFSGQLLPGTQSIDLLPYQIGAMALGGTFSSRLVQALRIERGISYGAHAWLGPARGGSGLFTHADVEASRLDEAIEVLLEQLDALYTSGISTSEFEFCKANVLKSMPFGLETAAMEAGQKVRLGILGRPQSDFDDREAKLKRLRHEQVQSAMSTLKHSGKRVILILCSYDQETRRKLGQILSPFEVEEYAWR